MKCPKCEVIELTMAERSGVEIDYCAACRGVWLDRGELDKIIERTSVPFHSSELASERRPQFPVLDRERERYDDDDDDDDRDERRGRRKKRSGFLGELFDF